MRTCCTWNQTDEAFEWLERAYAKRDDGLIATKIEPLLTSCTTTCDLPRS
jgi:hypothetical protein